MTPEVRGYLKTLRRIPDHLMLAIGARPIDPLSAQSCVCGWAIREALASVSGVAAENHHVPNGTAGTAERWCNASHASVQLFGGSVESWEAVFLGAAYDDRVEEAFARRVAECVKV